MNDIHAEEGMLPFCISGNFGTDQDKVVDNECIITMALHYQKLI